ncbi:MAG: glycosyltransferase family 4 protein [Gammaproteobacteria bacterium]
MKKLNIGILSYRSAPFSGGQGIYVYEISKILKGLGHKITVISGPPYPYLDRDIKLIKLPGLNLFSTFNFKDRLVKFRKKHPKSLDDFYEFFIALIGGFPEMRTFGNRAKRLIKPGDFDILIDNQCLAYGLLDLQKHTPILTVIHHPISKDKYFELLFSKSVIRRFFIRRWYGFLRMQKKVSKNMQYIVTPSSSSQADINRDFGVKMNRISVIPNGIDSAIFTPLNNRKEFQNNYRVITTASADVPLKGLSFTIRAIHHLKELFPKIHLTVIGQPKSGGYTERLIDELDVSEYISFKTNLSKAEIAFEYACSSVAVVSSLYEGFGFPVGEAMACNVPLIATKVASIPEITSSYATLVKPDSSSEIANALVEIFQDYAVFQARAFEGLAHIQNNFNWEKLALRYQDLLFRILEERHADL